MSSFKSDAVAGVVVWYCPKKSYVDNLKTYSKHLDHTWVIDNSPSDNFHLLDGLGSVTYFFVGRNSGVANGMNEGCSRAIQKGYQYILTMDQDSFFDENDIDRHLKMGLKVMINNEIAVVSPTFTCHVASISSSDLFEAKSSITSGSIIRLSTWRLIGGLEGKFFMDQIDHEFCIRLRREKYKIIVNPKVYMHHSIGNPITKKIFGREITSYNHYPGQRYYYIRNSLYIRRHYPEFRKQLFLYLCDIRDHCIKTILIEKEVGKKLFLMVLGFIDFLLNRYGRLEDNHPNICRIMRLGRRKNN